MCFALLVRRRARSLLWISQLTRTEANLDLKYQERFEGGVVASARASLRRSPLTACRLPLAALTACHSPLRAAPLSLPVSCRSFTTLRCSCQDRTNNHQNQHGNFFLIAYSLNQAGVPRCALSPLCVRVRARAKKISHFLTKTCRFLKEVGW